MTAAPYDVIGEKALYEMIDYFYFLVESGQRISYLFPGNFKEIGRKQKQFLAQFLEGPDLYTQEHGHPMLKKNIWHLELLPMKEIHG